MSTYGSLDNHNYTKKRIYMDNLFYEEFLQNKRVPIGYHNVLLEKLQRAQCALLEMFSERWPFRHRLKIPSARVKLLVDISKTSSWHAYAINSRHWRRHVCIACGWIADILPREVSIFEPGCGSGANLLWLASQGFHNVSGSDIDESALQLCNALQMETNISFPVWKDDGIQPQLPPQPCNVILSVNWLYHIKGASLDAFVETYLPYLTSRGAIVCDMVDSAFNHVENNMYHTKDWNKPVAERRPSEYTLRMFGDEVAHVAARHGLRIVRHAKIHGVPQRAVYMLAR